MSHLGVVFTYSCLCYQAAMPPSPPSLHLPCILSPTVAIVLIHSPSVSLFSPFVSHQEPRCRRYLDYRPPSPRSVKQHCTRALPVEPSLGAGHGWRRRMDLPSLFRMFLPFFLPVPALRVSPEVESETGDGPAVHLPQLVMPMVFLPIPNVRLSTHPTWWLTHRTSIYY